MFTEKGKGGKCGEKPVSKEGPGSLVRPANTEACEYSSVVTNVGL